MINALTTINLAEEQIKDKNCKTARDKYEKTCKKQEEHKDSLEVMRKSSINENLNEDSPKTVTKDISQMKTDEENVYKDEEEIVELDNGLIGTSVRRILVPESLKEKILKRHLGVKKTTARIQRIFK